MGEAATKPPVGWAACARAFKTLEARVDALAKDSHPPIDLTPMVDELLDARGYRPKRPFDRRWEPIEGAPKYLEKGEVPDEFVVLLYDPDNEAPYRRQMGFWNANYGDWQSCDAQAGKLIGPSHFMRLPDPPEEFA